jgi:hypothetical protein
MLFGLFVYQNSRSINQLARKSKSCGKMIKNHEINEKDIDSIHVK